MLRPCPSSRRHGRTVGHIWRRRQTVREKIGRWGRSSQLK
jgi:hypothetical protein